MVKVIVWGCRERRADISLCSKMNASCFAHCIDVETSHGCEERRRQTQKSELRVEFLPFFSKEVYDYLKDHM